MPIQASDLAPSGAPIGEASELATLREASEGATSQPLRAEDVTGARAAGESVDALSGSPASDEPYGVSTNLTPSGLEIYYQSGPKRLYRVREDVDASDWVEVPSVTTVNGVIDKSGALTWWGQGVGGIGTLKLQMLGVDLAPVFGLLAAGADDDARRVLCEALTEKKISTNEVRDNASDRGVNVHAAFEQWAEDQRITPQPIVFPEHERGYIQGLADFLAALTAGEPTDITAEVMVASVKRRFAGRYDLRLTLQKPVEVITRIYPVKPPKVETIPAGRYLLDLKTSKEVYETHYIQLEAYEGASLECGYEKTDYRGVIHVAADGRYELHVNQLKNDVQQWDYDDFLVVRELYRVLKEVKRRKGQRR